MQPDAVPQQARSSVRRLPRGPGVYRFRASKGRAMYIGRATDLRSRVGSYWGDPTGRAHLRRMVPTHGCPASIRRNRP